MQTTELFDPLEAERLELAYSDLKARDRVWEAHGTEPPREDLNIFFDNLPGETVLDVGCGWGYYIHEFLDRDLDYHGIDLSPEMIEIARETNPEARLDVMSYREVATKFPPDAFHGIWCSCVFGGEPKHNMPTILRGLKRVLRPGGIMTVVMPITWGSVDELAHDPEGNPIGWHACYEPGELHQLVESVGFMEVISFDRRMHGAATIMVRK
jgi:cyclopropane fatty-acyl-phospholipid synthase-like methyltransferase